MKLDDKRKVIEVLLCGAQMGCVTAGRELGADRRTVTRAVRLRANAMRTLQVAPSFMSCGLEAAYRPIESSPTLIREWFGKERGR